MTTQTQEKEVITLKDLAKQADIEPRLLRRILRRKFAREKAKVRYQWEPGDPQVQEILEAVKASKEKATKDKEKPAKVNTPKAEKAQPVKAEKPASKILGNVPPGAEPATDPFPKPKNSKPIRKTPAQLKAEGVDIKPDNVD